MSASRHLPRIAPRPLSVTDRLELNQWAYKVVQTRKLSVAKMTAHSGVFTIGPRPPPLKSEKMLMAKKCNITEVQIAPIIYATADEEDAYMF